MTTTDLTTTGFDVAAAARAEMRAAEAREPQWAIR